MRRRPHPIQLAESSLSGALVAALMAGCASTPNIPVNVPNDPIVADAENATIVVIQPTWEHPNLNLVDGKRQFVGQPPAHAQTVVRVPPGPCCLYRVKNTHAQYGDRIEGTGAAGKIYFATVSPTRAGGSALRPSRRERAQQASFPGPPSSELLLARHPWDT